MKDKETVTNNWYSDGKLLKLLQYYTENINVSPCLSKEEELSSKLIELYKEGKGQFIIPLNVNALTGELGGNTNHWVGLYITIGSYSEIKINYIDPIGRPIDPKIKEMIQTECKSSVVEQPLLNQGIQYTQQVSEIELSGNIDDCGPFLIYCLACINRKLSLPPKIISQTESDSLGLFLRESFDGSKSFDKIYKTTCSKNLPL